MPRKSSVIKKITDGINDGLDVVEGVTRYDGPDPTFVSDIIEVKPGKKGKGKDKDGDSKPIISLI